MNSNIRIIYLYIVCFVTLGMIVTGISATVNSISSYFYPDDYVFFQTENNTYNNYTYYTDDYNEAEQNEIEKENYKTEQIKNAVVSLAVFVIGVIMYKYHWNIIEKEKNK